MRAYLASVMAISVVSALTSLLLPDGKPSKKYLRFVIGAVALLIIAEPLSGLADAPFKLEFTFPDAETAHEDGDYLDAVIKNAEAVIADDIKEELRSLYRLSERYADVYVRLDAANTSDARVAELIITLKSYGAWADARSISDYFSDKYDCEVKITYE